MSGASVAPQGTRAVGPERTDRLRFAADVRAGLATRPWQIPSRYLYDDLGSALFEAICRLPWYPITRAEERLLAVHGRELVGCVRPATIVELGSGSGEKLKLLLSRSDLDLSDVDIHLVDLSAAALELSAQALTSLGAARIVGHEASYEEGLSAASRGFRPGPVLVLFLGSNIGNFDPSACEAFLDSLRQALRPGDRLLLGTDLVKPDTDLLLAYDDPLGVTAAFNRNLLVRVNRELGGDFAVDRFAHRAVWNPAASRMEMYLVSRSDQVIRVPGAGVEFLMRAGEAIWTECSYKYQQEQIAPLLESAGFRAERQWSDARDLFLLTLAAAV